LLYLYPTFRTIFVAMMQFSEFKFSVHKYFAHLSYIQITDPLKVPHFID